MNKANCLSLLSNAVLVWNSKRVGEIVAQLRLMEMRFAMAISRGCRR